MILQAFFGAQLTGGQRGVLFGITKDELKLEPGAVERPDLLGWHAGIGACQDDAPQNFASLIEVLDDHDPKKALKMGCPHHMSPNLLLCRTWNADPTGEIHKVHFPLPFLPTTTSFRMLSYNNGSCSFEVTKKDPAKMGL